MSMETDKKIIAILLDLVMESGAILSTRYLGWSSQKERKEKTDSLVLEAVLKIKEVFNA
jgi:hypothetical protein